MIKFITTNDLLSMRNDNLREGRLTPEECVFDGDDDPHSFHLGYYEGEKLVSIASFHLKPYDDPAHPSLIQLPAGIAYRLRGMATDPAHRMKGIGSKLINFAIIYLRGRKVNYLWCHARQVAYSFYQGIGFEFISDEFNIEGIGVHKTMYLKIQ